MSNSLTKSHKLKRWEEKDNSPLLSVRKNRPSSSKSKSKGGDAKNTSTATKKPGSKKGRVLHPIQLRLRELGRTQKWLAQQLGVSEQTIGNICRGRTRLLPYQTKTARLKTVLKVDYNYLCLGPFGLRNGK